MVDFGEDVCLFCMEILVEYEEDKEVCCLNSYIQCVGYQFVCVECGFVEGYGPVNEFIDYQIQVQEKGYLIHRKYCIERIINYLTLKENMILRSTEIFSSIIAWKSWYEIATKLPLLVLQYAFTEFCDETEIMF